MSQFDESKIRRDAEGKFANKGPAAEADSVDLSATAAGEPTDDRVVRTYDEVETDYDGETFDTYEEAVALAKKVNDEGYTAVVHATRKYNPETDVYEGDISYSEESYEVKTFNYDGGMSVWMNRQGMSLDVGRPDGTVMVSDDHYEDPYTGEREVHEGYLHRPEVPAEDRMCRHYVSPGEVRAGDYIEHMGKPHEVLSVDNDNKSTSFELEYEMVSYPNDDPVMKFEPNVLSEDEFTRRFDPHGPDEGGMYEFEDVQDDDPKNVWTVVEGDSGELYAAPGFHVVNKLGYLKSEKPWTSEGTTAAWMIHDDEERWREEMEMASEDEDWDDED